MIGRSAVLAAALYAWTVRAVLRRKLDRLKDGDVGPRLGIYSEDVRLLMPGRRSWAGEYRGKGEVERWMRRYVRADVRLEPRELSVAEPDEYLASHEKSAGLFAPGR